MPEVVVFLQNRMLGQDALAHDLPHHLLYAFTPLTVILPMLDRIHELVLSVTFKITGNTTDHLFSRCQNTLGASLPKDLLSQTDGEIWHA